IISSFFFFPFILRRLPFSTLFSYTTLFRSRYWYQCFFRTKFPQSGYCADAVVHKRQSVWRSPSADQTVQRDRLAVLMQAAQPGRSEEHTSELQSLRHLVCRLLLEKKNL